jgi:hypothetical protein
MLHCAGERHDIFDKVENRARVAAENTAEDLPHHSLGHHQKLLTKRRGQLGATLWVLHQDLESIRVVALWS